MCGLLVDFKDLNDSGDGKYDMVYAKKSLCRFLKNRKNVLLVGKIFYFYLKYRK